MNIALNSYRSSIVSVVIGLGSTFCQAAGTATSANLDPPISMAPVRVVDSSLHFGFGISTWVGRDSNRNVMITELERGSLAEKAGLAVADRIMLIDGKPVARCDQLTLATLFSRAAPPGQMLTWVFAIERGSSHQLRVVNLKARNGATGQALASTGPAVAAGLVPVSSPAPPKP